MTVSPGNRDHPLPPRHPPNDGTGFAGQDPANIRERFDEDGFCALPGVVEPEMVGLARHHVDRVVAGSYDTGEEPHYRNCDPATSLPGRLVKVDQAHLCDTVLRQLAGHHGVGAMAAQLVDAQRVQVWATQLLVKPPDVADEGNVGWHQDTLYWGDFWEGDVFTAWIALSDITAQTGPVRFVVGSHRWGFESAGSFLAHDLEGLAQQYTVPTGEKWREEVAVVPAGGVSFHHRLTIHGSGPNESAAPRIAMTLHLCTERATCQPNAGPTFGFDLDDTERFPILYEGVRR